MYRRVLRQQAGIMWCIRCTAAPEDVSFLVQQDQDTPLVVSRVLGVDSMPVWGA